MKLILLVSLFVATTSSAFARSVVCTSNDGNGYQIAFESKNRDVLNDIYTRQTGSWELAHRMLRYPMKFKKEGTDYKGYFTASIFPRDTGAAGTGNFLVVPPQMPTTGSFSILLKVDVGGGSFNRVFEEVFFTCQ